jgi:hypothetical protein
VERLRPFKLIVGRPLATFGVVLFSVLFVATAFADPKDPSRFSIAPFSVIAILAAISTTYVLTVVPRLQRAAAARNALSRPRRRPVREQAGDASAESPSLPTDD